MNIVDMYTLVKHPTEPNAYTYLYAFRAHKLYNALAPTYYFDKVINNEIFFTRNTAIIQKENRIVTGYYLSKKEVKNFKFKRVLDEIENYYNITLPKKRRIVYIDYLRSHIVYDDGTTLKATKNKLYHLRPDPSIDNVNIFYTAEEGSYATITGAELIIIRNGKITMLLGYNKQINLSPEMLEHLASLDSTETIVTTISLIQ